MPLNLPVNFRLTNDKVSTNYRMYKAHQKETLMIPKLSILSMYYLIFIFKGWISNFESYLVL